jgi:predicted nucleic acid-binding Zn ribbon protein
MSEIIDHKHCSNCGRTIPIDRDICQECIDKKIEQK